MKTPRKSFKSIDEFIKYFPKEIAERLKAIRKIVNKHAPQVVETISYNIPTFKIDGKYFIYMAGYKNHVGIYPYSASMKLTEKELQKYRTGKGTLQFPMDEKLPVVLIEKIVKNKVKETLNKNNKSPN